MDQDKYRDDLAEMEADRDRLRSLLSDWDDQVARLQTLILNLETERDRALHDQDRPRASITHFATSLVMLPSSCLVVVAPPLPGSSGVKDPVASPTVHSKRLRTSL